VDNNEPPAGPRSPGAALKGDLRREQGGLYGILGRSKGGISHDIVCTLRSDRPDSGDVVAAITLWRDSGRDTYGAIALVLSLNVLCLRILPGLHVLCPYLLLPYRAVCPATKTSRSTQALACDAMNQKQAQFRQRHATASATILVSLSRWSDPKPFDWCCWHYSIRMIYVAFITPKEVV